MSSNPPTPTWVFTYLPAPKPLPSSTPSSSTTPTTSTSSTPTLLTTLHRALFTPKLGPEQDRIATLQGVKASLEQQIAFRQRAGLSTRDLEREVMARVEGALGGLVREEGRRWD